MRRVVVTGLGIVCPIGNDKEEVTRALKTGRSGIVFCEEYRELGFRSHVHGSVKIDPKILGFIDFASIHLHGGVRDAQHARNGYEEAVQQARNTYDELAKHARKGYEEAIQQARDAGEAVIDGIRTFVGEPEVGHALDVADRKHAYAYEDLLRCAHGELFGPGNARLPLPPLLMFDRILEISETEGKYGKGQIVAMGVRRGDSAVPKPL